MSWANHHPCLVPQFSCRSLNTDDLTFNRHDDDDDVSERSEGISHTDSSTTQQQARDDGGAAFARHSGAVTLSHGFIFPILA
jgi:hypothetical protein